jgi:uncharacterized repeat protein (TIGR01451 family)
MVIAVVLMNPIYSSHAQNSAACQDGIDNDGDGGADYLDQGCYSNGFFIPTDTNEGDGPALNVSSSSSSSSFSSHTSSFSSSSSSFQSSAANLAALNLTITDDQTTIEPGEVLTYSIIVSNNGTTNVQDAIVIAMLPSSATFVLASDAGAVSGQTIVWNNLRVDAGSSRELNLYARVSSNIDHNAIITTNVRIQSGKSASDSTPRPTPRQSRISRKPPPISNWPRTNSTA